MPDARDHDLIRYRRVQYESDGLDLADVSADPIEQWIRWHRDAFEAGVAEPNAMVLATVGPGAAASVRAVLVRRVDARGFVFFTNYESPKSTDMAANPHVAGVFLWIDLHRQVRVRGTAELVPERESDDYFASRPRDSQIGAWASPQSREISGRAELEASVARYAEQFAGVGQVPRPEFWGGWRLVPDEIEFWQGRPSRLHDRLVYRLAADTGVWHIVRLAP